MQIKSMLLIVAVLAVGAQAQEPGNRETFTEQQAATNDDRGRAFIIEREPAPLSAAIHSGRVVVSEPHQYSIFLGRGWTTPALRARQAELGNLLVNLRDPATLRALNEAGVKNLYGPTSNREQLDDRTGSISDLQIQNILSTMVKEGSPSASTENTIYVVFLDPDLHSTLGAMLAGKHYAAYHNFFNATRVKLHYVVVPFEADRKAANQIALRAFLAAALNPTGETW
jgi:hypothetical protein